MYILEKNIKSNFQKLTTALVKILGLEFPDTHRYKNYIFKIFIK